MEPLRLLIVDDEPLARERARRLCERVGGVEIVAEATDGAKALPLIEEHAPDAVLLDIQMPEVDGLRLLEALDDPPAVIFSTAFEHHAVRAFDLQAVDYLLKPYSAERLARALGRVRRTLGARAEPVAPSPTRRIPADEGAGSRLLLPAQVDAAYIEEAVVFLVLGEGEQLTFNGSLQDLEELLPPGAFFRISRQCLVRVESIVRATPLEDGGMRVETESGWRGDVSRRRARLLRPLLGGRAPRA